VLPAAVMVVLLAAEVAAQQEDVDYRAAAELRRFRPSGNSSAG
jgi:hypothetical protein